MTEDSPRDPAPQPAAPLPLADPPQPPPPPLAVPPPPVTPVAASPFTPVIREPWVNPAKRTPLLLTALALALLLIGGSFLVGLAVGDHGDKHRGHGGRAEFVRPGYARQLPYPGGRGLVPVPRQVPPVTVVPATPSAVPSPASS